MRLLASVPGKYSATLQRGSSPRLQTVKMACMRANVAAKGGVVRRERAQVVCRAADKQATVAAVALAAAALVSAPAQAGVILEQPQLKKVFQADDTPAQKVERPFRNPLASSSSPASAPSPKAEAKKVDEEPLGDAGLDPRAVALPASIAAIAGLGLVASKVDNGFSEWITESGALVKSSEINGVGYEEAIKDGPVTGTRRVGTQKVGSKKGRK